MAKKNDQRFLRINDPSLRSDLILDRVMLKTLIWMLKHNFKDQGWQGGLWATRSSLEWLKRVDAV